VQEVDFQITIEAEQDGTSVVALAGEVDLYRVPAVEESLAAAEGGRVVVDLRGVTFLDSATLALLVSEQRRLRKSGRELIVRVGPQTPMAVFAVSGFDRVLRIERNGAGPEEASA
jgi:anti-sigma B factor antagonist